MIPEDNSLILFKFGAEKWQTRLKVGELSFSCPGQYVRIAEREGNAEQGDLYEAVFARVKRNDPRVAECEKQFGKDLEIIKYGEYVLLRRKSSLFIPTFCFYSYRGTDLLENVRKPGRQTITHYFDERVFSGFTKDEVRNVVSMEYMPTSLIIQARPFHEQVVNAARRERISAEIRHIDYTEFESDEFFIEPTSQREELFYKFPKYSYQKEARIVLHGMKLPTIYERFTLNIGPLLDEDAPMIKGGPFYFQFNDAHIVTKRK